MGQTHSGVQRMLPGPLFAPIDQSRRRPIPAWRAAPQPRCALYSNEATWHYRWNSEASHFPMMLPTDAALNVRIGLIHPIAAFAAFPSRCDDISAAYLNLRRDLQYRMRENPSNSACELRLSRLAK